MVTGRTYRAERGITTAGAQRSHRRQPGTRRHGRRVPRPCAGVRVGVEPSPAGTRDALDAVEVIGRMHALEVVAGGRDRLQRHQGVTETSPVRPIDHGPESLRSLRVPRPRQVLEVGGVSGEQHRHEDDATVRRMTNGAERTLSRRAPTLLHGTQCSARVRQWSFRPHTAHLVMIHQPVPPTDDDLTHWLTELAAAGFRHVRTNAIGATMHQRLERLGFSTVQELVLLEHLTPADAPMPTGGTVRLDPLADGRASAIDALAFGEEWSLDADAIDDVRHATPRHRARAITVHDQLAAYAITGRDARSGFVQRLAVDPMHHRRGLGRELVLDALRWLTRWRVHRVLVNTAIDNHPARRLYASVGFHELDERLRVVERALT